MLSETGNTQMRWVYRNVMANIGFSPITKSFYGEVILQEQLFTFQASTKQEIIQQIKNVADQLYVAIPEV